MCSVTVPSSLEQYAEDPYAVIYSNDDLHGRQSLQKRSNGEIAVVCSFCILETVV